MIEARDDGALDRAVVMETIKEVGKFVMIFESNINKTCWVVGN